MTTETPTYDKVVRQPRAEFFDAQRAYIKALGFEARNCLTAEMHPMFTILTLVVRNPDDTLIYDADDPRGIRTETVIVGLEALTNE